MGKWQGAWAGDGGYAKIDTFVFNKDHTYTDTTDFPPIVMNSGAWLVDPTSAGIGPGTGVYTKQ